MYVCTTVKNNDKILVFFLGGGGEAYLGNCEKQFSCKVKHDYVTKTMKKKLILITSF